MKSKGNVDQKYCDQGKLAYPCGLLTVSQEPSLEILEETAQSLSEVASESVEKQKPDS